MAGTVTCTETMLGTVKRLLFTWTSSAGGAADATTTKLYDGRILAVIQSPGSAGVQPSADYDVQVTDGDGFDVLHGLGTDVSNAGDTFLTQEDKVGAAGYSKLTLAVTAAGDTKEGRTLLLIR